MAYTGSIELISGLKQKNNGSFPLINAADIYVDDNTRLNSALTDILNRIIALETIQEERASQTFGRGVFGTAKFA